ncbi:MAG: anhydro-N-acetylmuramic acid kinase [Bradyrhizobiaceae bacterium]|nr:anhydro-N-acetylmuramic acid kinase [Bradyrhizobiaceae bacterium]
MQAMTAIGLMSGTSFDGVDVALIETDGETIARIGPSGYRPYSEAERATLRAALLDAVSLTDRTARPGVLAKAEALVIRAHAEAVDVFLKAHGLAASEIGIIGFHGQTVLHRPRERLTVQIGGGQALANRFGIPVVYDFRAADVAAGGEGAPLLPVYHRALAMRSSLKGPVAIVNLGGVGNITFLDGDADPVAFDTGPANAPIDDLVFKRTGARCDTDGRLAAAGTVDESAVAAVLEHPFFAKRPPKSLDRAEFASLPLDDLSLKDAAATATAIVAASVARALDFLPKRPGAFVIVGGGASNPTLMKMLRAHLGGEVRTANELGWSADALEAQGFAYMAVRSLRGLPITFPTTTGVKAPMTGGVLAEPR